MIQRQIARIFDEISSIYMSVQKKGPQMTYYQGGAKEFLSGKNAIDPMIDFANPGVVPHLQFTKDTRRRDYSLKFFQYKSLVETPHKHNNTVHGRLYEIPGRPDAPTVVVLHGWHMASYHFFDYYCRLLVNAGFNAMMIDLPYHMNRRVPGTFHGEFTINDDAVLTFLVVQQSVSDAQQAINWARSRGAPLTGMFGVSLGAMLCGLTGCVEPLVDFMMLVVPPVDLYDLFTAGPLGRLFKTQNPKLFEELEQYKSTFDSVSLLNLKPQMPPERIFLVLAEYDGLIRTHKIDELWLAWNRPYMERYLHGHISVMLINPSMNRDMRRWLRTIHNPRANSNQSKEYWK